MVVTLLVAQEDAARMRTCPNPDATCLVPIVSKNKNRQMHPAIIIGDLQEWSPTTAGIDHGFCRNTVKNI